MATILNSVSSPRAPLPLPACTSSPAADAVLADAADAAARSSVGHERKRCAPITTSSGAPHSAGLGQNWQEFNQKLKLIRQAGYYAAPGDIHPDSYGIGAPIMHTKGVAGSLTIGRRLINLKEREIPYLIELAVDTAAQISTTIQAIQAKTKNETAD
jgi:DNA-binding IclR family transcriptional regulator